MSRYFDRKSAVRVRAKERKRRGSMAWLAVVLAIALSAAAGLIIKHQGLYMIRAVHVQGCRIVPQAAVSDIMNTAVGRPMWHSNRQALARLARELQPGIESVETSILPWGTLEVKIAERQGVARIEASSTMCIDDEGMVFEDRTGGASGLPSLRLAGSSERGRRRALTAILAAGDADPSWVFDGSKEDNVTVQVAPQTLAELGNGQFAGKWRRLREILNGQGQAELPPCTIDLRFSNQGIIRKQV